MTQVAFFSVNGQSYYLHREITLFEMLNYFNYNDSLLVLEYNDWICNKKDWKNIFLKDKDKVEVVTIVGGG